jgi:hypothetical protein
MCIKTNHQIIYKHSLMDGDERKLRVLALHSFRTSASIFKEQASHEQWKDSNISILIQRLYCVTMLYYRSVVQSNADASRQREPVGAS